MADGMLALTWNNHSSTFSKTISSLRVKEQYTDVTITCEGKFYQVHKFVLATCSDYFEKIFQETPCKHPVVVLRDVSCDELEALLNYMYIGSVSVAQSDLARLIKVAELLQIKGLAVPDDPPKSSDGDSDVSNNDNRDRSDSRISSSGHESTRTSSYTKRSKNSHYGSDTYSPHRKRMRSQDSLSMSETHHSRGVQNKNETVSNSSSNDQFHPYEVHVKEEVHDVIDSESESQEEKQPGTLMPKTEVLDLPVSENYTQENTHISPSYIPGSESQDIPPDGQPVSQTVLGTPSFSEELLSLPGPSDAQEWYSEGEASGTDCTQELLSLEASQQQSQRMAVLNAASLAFVSSKRTSEEFICSSCNYSTWNKTNFLKHQAVHTGEKPFQCTYCPAKFSQKANMIRHTRIHTGEKPFACFKCPYRATQKTLLDYHVVRKHDTASATNISHL
ncbi:hypothetical protein SK128_014394 [Halocaridina rubra]|uniref:Uncharacterized protein n=1 Tax=Halocaridina rubra TaxID=373956 RepID=A0AAN9A5D6_HALRR